ncbi:MAG: prephenate dehydrogenase/arogenate dehydrogenase family protein [Planctomycetes bacterium]|nr:prephenate dehydrogenase/arogenate dehydrogenase family protein [Planctomycetota bacterium]
MKDKQFDEITIVGVGLLGGSLGLAVKAANPAARIVGVGHRARSLQEALTIGAIDACSLEAAEGVRDASLVVLCTPVGLFSGLLKAIAPALKPGCIVTDVGSTKAVVVRTAERILGGRVAFVGSHPIAGSERRGVTFARTDLYVGNTCVLTPTPRTCPKALKKVDRFWRGLGMATVQMAPAVHDRTLGRISHLPHALAALLVNVQRPGDLDLAGSGFIDATRIAGGDPVLWRDIFLTNRGGIEQALNAYQRQLSQLRDLLRRSDGPAMERLFARAQRRRAELLEKRLRQKRVEG